MQDDLDWLPMTRKEMRLYIFVLGNMLKGIKLKGINVLEGRPWDPALLLTVLVAVRFLLHHLIIQFELMTKAKPSRTISLKPLGKRAFLDKEAGKVWKFFLPGTAARVNKNIYKLLLENTSYNKKDCNTLLPCMVG